MHLQAILNFMVHFPLKLELKMSDDLIKQSIILRIRNLDTYIYSETSQLNIQSVVSSILTDLSILQHSQFQHNHIDDELTSIEQQLRDRLFSFEVQLTKKQFTPPVSKRESIKHDDIDINTLRKRLLTSETNQFDSIDSENNYHDSIQSDLIDSLPAMVSAIKDQALQFQEMIQNDASILKDVTNKFEMSQGKFTSVNDALNKYQKEGKLGLWFYIRVIGIIFMSFITLLVLIRLIPAR